jgi:hypothetical protein
MQGRTKSPRDVVGSTESLPSHLPCAVLPHKFEDMLAREGRRVDRGGLWSVDPGGVINDGTSSMRLSRPFPPASERGNGPRDAGPHSRAVRLQASHQYPRKGQGTPRQKMLSQTPRRWDQVATHEMRKSARGCAADKVPTAVIHLSTVGAYGVF